MQPTLSHTTRTKRLLGNDLVDLREDLVVSGKTCLFSPLRLQPELFIRRFDRNTIAGTASALKAYHLTPFWGHVQGSESRARRLPIPAASVFSPC
jgi:hypothetical protein